MKHFDAVALDNDSEGKRRTSFKITFAHAICVALKLVRDFCDSIGHLKEFDATLYLPVDFQLQLLKETRAQFNAIVRSAEMEWLVPKIKQLWYCILTFENVFAAEHRSSLALDLKFLIQLEQEGFTDSLKCFKHFD